MRASHRMRPACYHISRKGPALRAMHAACDFGVRDTGMSRRLGCLAVMGIFFAFVLAGCAALSKGDTPVPDVLGYRIETAEAALQIGGLKLGEIEYDEDAEGAWGVITSQDPEPGDLTLPNSEVDVVIAGPDLVPLPMVVGRDESVARTELQKSDLRIGKVTKEYDDRYPEGVVIAQEPEDALWAPRHSSIDLVVSLGPESAPVPGVIGMWEDDAEKFVLGLGFKTDIDWEYSRYAEGVVTEQFPPPGADTKIGDLVEITVSEGAPPVEVPDVRGLEYASAEDIIRAAGLVIEVERVRVENLGSDVPIVERQYPYPGQQVPQGSGMTLVVWEE